MSARRAMERRLLAALYELYARREHEQAKRERRERRRVPEHLAAAQLARLVAAATEEARLRVAEIRGEIERQRARQEAVTAWAVGLGPHPDAEVRKVLAELAEERKRNGAPRPVHLHVAL